MTSSSQRKERLRKWQICLYPVPAIIFLIIWHVLTYNNQQRQFIFSSPDQVWLALCRTVSDGELWRNSLVTIWEAICGFILGTTFGALLGLSLWYSRTIALIAQPYITALATIPIFALAPIVISWFGIGTTSKIALAFISTLAVAIVQSYQGAMSVEEKYLRLLKVCGASRIQTFFILVVPSSIIWVINAMKLNIGLALLGAFIGEFISAEEGLGYMIVKASGLYDMATVLVGVLALIVIALVLTATVSWLEAKLLHWKQA